MGELIGGQFLGILIGSLIGAVILRAAAKWIIKEDITFGDAYITVFLSAVINLVIGFIIGFAVGSATQSPEAVNVATYVSIPIGFLIQSWIISSRLHTSFGTACLISLTMFGIMIGIGLIVGGIVFVVMQATA